MMDVMLLISVVLVILAIFFVLSIMKKLIKFAVIVGLIFLVLFLITGGSIMGDFDSLKEKVSMSPNLVLFEDEGNILTGIVDSEKISLLDESEIALLDGLYSENKLEKMKEDYYKVFIIKTVVIEELEAMEINNKEVTSDDMLDFFVDNKPIVSITYEDLLLDLEVEEGNRNNKAALLAYLYEKELKITKSPIDFFENYKQKEIIVYPETIFFKFTKIIPITWIKGKLNKLQDAVKEKTDEAVEGAVEIAKEKISGE
jgi:hypothetical protein